jgi:excisionase family DNA binding protein
MSISESSDPTPERWFWTKKDVERLKSMRNSHSPEDIAAALGRTRGAVLQKLQRLFPPAPRPREKKTETAPRPLQLGPMPHDLPQFLSVDDVVELLRLSKARVKQLVATGELPSVKIGQRRLIRAEAYKKFAESLG